MKYQYKPNEVEAIQFSYTPEGVTALMTFAAGDFTGARQGREGKAPVAFIADLILIEGSWLVKRGQGGYMVMKDELFNNLFQLVPDEGTGIIVEKDIRPVAPEAAGIDMQAIVTPEEAREKGLRRYFTGEPCKYGHIAERYLSTNGCAVCVSESAKATRAANKRREKAREASKRHYHKHHSVAAREAASQNLPLWLAPLKG